MKRKLLLTLIVVVLLLALSMTFFACKKDQHEEDRYAFFYVNGREYARVLINESFAMPDDPTENGYTFEGWYMDSACTVPFNRDAVIGAEGNVELYAKLTLIGDGSENTPVDPVATEVKYQAPEIPTYSNDEAFERFFPIIEMLSGETYDAEDKLMMKEEYFADICDKVLKPAGISLDEIDLLANGVRTLYNSWLGKVIQGVRDGGVTSEELLTSENINLTCNTLRTLVDSMNANQMIVFIDTLINYINYRGLDPVEDLSDGGAYEPIHRQTMENLFGAKGVTSFDTLSRISSALKTDEGATVVNNLMDVFKNACRFSSDSYVKISKAMSNAYPAAHSGLAAINYVELTEGINEIGKLIDACLRNLDGNRLYAFVSPLLEKCGLEEEYAWATEFLIRADVLKSVGDVLKGVKANQVKALCYYISEGGNVQKAKAAGNLTNNDLISLLNYAGQSLNLFLNRVQDTDFFTHTMEPVFRLMMGHTANKRMAEYSSELARPEYLRMIANLAQNATAETIIDLYNKYEDANVKDGSKEKGAFVAAIMNFIAPEFAKLSAEARTSLDTFCRNAALYDGSFVADIAELITLSASASTDDQFTALYEKITAMDDKFGAAEDKMILVCENHATKGITVDNDVTREELVQMLMISGYSFYEPKTNTNYSADKVDFSYSISADNSYVILTHDLLQADTKLELISDPSAVYELTYTEFDCPYIRLPINETEEKVRLRLQSTFVDDDFLVKNKVNGQSRALYFQAQWIEKGLFSIKELRYFDSSSAGLFAGVALLTCYLGDIEIPFLYRVYDPDVTRAVAIDYEYTQMTWDYDGYYYTENGNKTIVLEKGETAVDLIRKGTFTVCYDSGVSGELYEGYTVSGLDTSTRGIRTCVVTYQGLSVTVRYRVYDPDDLHIRSMSVYREVYSVPKGSRPDDSELVSYLRITYDSGDHETIYEGYTVSGFDSSNVGRYSYTVTYRGKTEKVYYTVYDYSGEPSEAEIVYLEAHRSSYYVSGYGYRYTDHFAIGTSLDEVMLGVHINVCSRMGSYNHYYDIDWESCNVSGFTSSTSGWHTLTISYGGKSATLDYYIWDPANPQINTISYDYGARFPIGTSQAEFFSGMHFNVQYDDLDDYKQIHNNYIFNGYTSATRGRKECTFTYTVGNSTKTITVNYYIYDPNDILVESLYYDYYYYYNNYNSTPTDDVYNYIMPIGTTANVLIDRAGVYVYYDSGERESLAGKDYTIEGFDTTRRGYRTCIISYRGKEVSLSYKVYDPNALVAESITYSTIKIPVNAAWSDLLNAASFRVRYDNGRTESIPTGEITNRGFYTGKRGRYVCTVTYLGLTKTVFYTVYDPDHPIVEYISSNYSYFSDDNWSWMQYNNDYNYPSYCYRGLRLTTNATAADLLTEANVRVTYDNPNLSGILTDVSAVKNFRAGRVGYQDVVIGVGEQSIRILCYVYDPANPRVEKLATKNYAYFAKDISVAEMKETAPVIAYYDDMTVSRVTDFDLAGTFDSSTTGEKRVSITKGGKYAILQYNIFDLTDLTMEDLQVSYSGANFQIGSTEADLRESITVTAYYYYDGEPISIVIADYTVSGFDASSVGTRTATVYYEGWTRSISYTVYDPNAVTIGGESVSASAIVDLGGGSVNRSISITGSQTYFRYTPTSSGTYSIYTTGDWDTYGYLYDANGYELDHNDDSNGGYNFGIGRSLTAGTTYYIGVRLYSSGNATVTLKIDKA